MEDVNISVIIPVYNTGKYLMESLSSLINQTFREFEIICVNDASDDKRTNELLDEYIKNDSRISVIWLKENVGAGEARNIGFANAKGEYVIFLDADDIFRTDMLEIMYNKIIEENADVCFCAYRAFYMNNGEKILTFEQRPSTYDRREDFFNDAIYSPWTKLCKSDFLKKNNIYFQSLQSCNDVFFSCMIYLKGKKQCKCDEHLVEYRTKNPDQISAKADGINFFRAIELVFKSISGDINEFHYKKQLLLKILINCNEYISNLNDKQKKLQCYSVLKEVLKKNKDIEKYNKKIYNYYIEKILTEEYNSNWFNNVFDFYSQLAFYKHDIIERLKNYKKIVLWGNGKRGQAFQRICQENNLNLIGIADSKNENIGGKTSYGYVIISSDDAFSKSDVIVACNFFVYNQLVDEHRNVPVINLEEYC